MPIFYKKPINFILNNENNNLLKKMIKFNDILYFNKREKCIQIMI